MKYIIMILSILLIGCQPIPGEQSTTYVTDNSERVDVEILYTDGYHKLIKITSSNETCYLASTFKGVALDCK